MCHILKHVILYKIYCTCVTFWHVWHYTNFDCNVSTHGCVWTVQFLKIHVCTFTPIALYDFDCFYCTLVHFDKSHTIPLSKVHVWLLPLVQLCNFWLYIGPRWQAFFVLHLSIVTSVVPYIFNSTPVHVDICCAVHVFIVHASTFTLVALYKFLLYTCPRRRLFRDINFYCTCVQGDTCCTAQVFGVHVSTSTYVVLYNFLLYPCTQPHAWYCATFRCARVHVDTHRAV